MDTQVTCVCMVCIFYDMVADFCRPYTGNIKEMLCIDQLYRNITAIIKTLHVHVDIFLVLRGSY